MKYTELKGYKYRVYETETIQTGFSIPLLKTTSPGVFEHPFFRIHEVGMITLIAGYAWNGANWCPDFKWIKRGSAFHDVGFQCGGMGIISIDLRIKFDELLRKLCIEDKAWKWEADTVYNMVRLFAGRAWTNPNKNDTKVLEAP